MFEHTEDSLARHADEIRTRGYTILERVIEPELVASLADALQDLEDRLQIQPGRNPFEGHHTIRIYNLLAYHRVFERIPVHPALLPIVERVLDAQCLVSSLSSISIDPGEGPQPIHSDDQLIGLRRPHPAIVCNSIWALTDFTAANGATRIIAGSHLRDHAPQFGQHYDSECAEMPAGSLLIWTGSLWHGGGANTTGQRRVGIAMNYCAGFIRQQENQQLGIPRERVAQFTPRLQELVGYGTWRDLVGHIDKAPPSVRLLGAESRFTSVWDQGPSAPAATTRTASTTTADGR